MGQESRPLPKQTQPLLKVKVEDIQLPLTTSVLMEQV